MPTHLSIPRSHWPDFARLIRVMDQIVLCLKRAHHAFNSATLSGKDRCGAEAVFDVATNDAASRTAVIMDAT